MIIMCANKNTIKNQSCVYINTDGASRDNPGNAAIGIVIKGEDKTTVLKEYGEFIGVHTNNQAEYMAVIKAMDFASEYTNKMIYIFSDSELLIKQLNREYRVKNSELKKLFFEVKKHEMIFEKVIYSHVKREHNKRADQLANKALDELIR